VSNIHVKIIEPAYLPLGCVFLEPNSDEVSVRMSSDGAEGSSPVKSQPSSPSSVSSSLSSHSSSYDTTDSGASSPLSLASSRGSIAQSHLHSDKRENRFNDEVDRSDESSADPSESDWPNLSSTSTIGHTAILTGQISNSKIQKESGALQPSPVVGLSPQTPGAHDSSALMSIISASPRLASSFHGPMSPNIMVQSMAAESERGFSSEVPETSPPVTPKPRPTVNMKRNLEEETVPQGSGQSQLPITPKRPRTNVFQRETPVDFATAFGEPTAELAGDPRQDNLLPDVAENVWSDVLSHFLDRPAPHTLRSDVSDLFDISSFADNEHWFMAATPDLVSGSSTNPSPSMGGEALQTPELIGLGTPSVVGSEPLQLGSDMSKDINPADFTFPEGMWPLFDTL
jgi:hypothetical protein